VALLALELYRLGERAAGDSLARYCTALLRTLPDTATNRAGAAAFCAEARRDFAESRRWYEVCCVGAHARVPQLARAGALAALSGDTAAARRYMRAIDAIPISAASDTRGFTSQFTAEQAEGKAMIAAALGEGGEAVALLQFAFGEWGAKRLRFRHGQSADPAYDRIRHDVRYQRLLETLP
jgi:hypothetical protein